MILVPNASGRLLMLRPSLASMGWCSFAGREIVSLVDRARSPQTLFDKIWNSHVVNQVDGQTLIHVDKQILHEGTSPLAFEGLRLKGRKVQRPGSMLGVIDHTVPTSDRRMPVTDPAAREMMAAFHEDAAEFGIRIFAERDREQGIVHVVGPEQGFTLPGTIIVCGDSHTSTHGAFGAFAFGIGTSEIEHVFACGTLWRTKPANMLVRIEGELPTGTVAKDVALSVLERLGVSRGMGKVIEFAGAAVRGLSMEGRMTLCNMAIELGARAGLIAPDATTFAYLNGRPFAPAGALWDQALAYWSTLHSDAGAVYDDQVVFDATTFRPLLTWGTSPQDVISVDGNVPDPADEPDEARAAAMRRSLQYMGLEPGMPIGAVAIDRVFIGSCTNGRIEDLRGAARIVGDQKVAPGVRAMIVPGSGLVKRQAEQEGLDVIFRKAGFEWREPGCSMCLAMNGDRLEPGERCASTSNRNFEGRQGRGGRTHLMSAELAAAAAISGRLAPVAAS